MDDWTDGEETPPGPVHPDDRLWRHPSELRALHLAPGVVPRPRQRASLRRPLGPRLLLGALAGAAVLGAWWTAESLEVDVDDTGASLASDGNPSTFAAGTDLTVDVTLSSRASTTLAVTAVLGLVGHEATVGLRVTALDPGTPLAEAGVRVGDDLLAVGGIATTSMSDLQAAVSLVGRRPDVPVDVARGHQRLQLEADFGG
jgi:membrane-associated protease RseP (regulator of RpoE activity)